MSQLGGTGAEVETKRDTVRIKIATFSAIPVDQSLILPRQFSRNDATYWARKLFYTQQAKRHVLTRIAIRAIQYEIYHSIEFFLPWPICKLLVLSTQYYFRYRAHNQKQISTFWPGIISASSFYHLLTCSNINELRCMSVFQSVSL